MRKYFVILIISLFIASPSHSKIIKLEKCFNSIHEKKFDKSKMDKWYYSINTKKRTGSMVMDYTDKYVKKINDKYRAEGNSYRLKETRIREYKVIYSDDNYAKLISSDSFKFEIIINFEDKTVNFENSKIQCR